MQRFIKPIVGLIRCILIVPIIFLVRSKKTPVEKSEKVVFFSRQSNEPSIDIQMLDKAMQKAGFRTRTICIKGGKVKHVLWDSWKCLWNLANSNCVVLDTYNASVSFWNWMLVGRKQLLVVQMWHSVGTMKKFGHCENGKPARKRLGDFLMRQHKGYDYILGASENYKTDLSDGFGYDQDKIKIYPLPRVQWLREQKGQANKSAAKEYTINTFEDIISSRKGASLIQESGVKKEIILYLPTMPKNKKAFKAAVEKLDAALDKKKDKYIGILHTHPLAERNLDNNALASLVLFTPEELKRFTKNQYEPVSLALLLMADHVITDYSAILYEAGILDIPTFLYYYDLEGYQKERGLFFNANSGHGNYCDLPYEKSGRAEDIMQAIEEKRYKRDEVSEFIGKYVEFREDETQEIANFLAQEIQSRRRPGDAE